jgi:hypothetical protein
MEGGERLEPHDQLDITMMLAGDPALTVSPHRPPSGKISHAASRNATTKHERAM